MKRLIRAAGYHGYSMSNNAVDAYESGEKPLSKWTKSAIITELEELSVSPDIINEAKKLSLDALKEIFLYKSSWHHTSKMYNRTKFYSVDENVSLNDIQRYLDDHTPKQNKGYRLCKIDFTGADHKIHTGYAIMSPFSVIVYDDGDVHKVAKFDRNFAILDTYEDIPSGAEDIFDKIFRRASIA